MLRLSPRCGEIIRAANFVRSFALFSFESKMQMQFHEKLSPPCAESLTDKHLCDDSCVCVQRGMVGVQPLTSNKVFRSV
jgi:hypothetical protein